MKYYSDVTHDLYDSVELLEQAELKVKREEEAKRKAKEEAEKKEKELKANRAAAAKEVEEAFKNYQKLLKDFCKTYGAFHMSLKSDDFFDFFNMF